MLQEGGVALGVFVFRIIFDTIVNLCDVRFVFLQLDARDVDVDLQRIVVFGIAKYIVLRTKTESTSFCCCCSDASHFVLGVGCHGLPPLD